MDDIQNGEHELNDDSESNESQNKIYEIINKPDSEIFKCEINDAKKKLCKRCSINCEYRTELLNNDENQQCIVPTQRILAIKKNIPIRRFNPKSIDANMMDIMQQYHIMYLENPKKHLDKWMSINSYMKKLYDEKSFYQKNVAVNVNASKDVAQRMVHDLFEKNLDKYKKRPGCTEIIDVEVESKDLEKSERVVKTNPQNKCKPNKV